MSAEPRADQRARAEGPDRGRTRRAALPRLPRRRRRAADRRRRGGDGGALGGARRVGRPAARLGRGGLGPARPDRGRARRVHAARRRPLPQRLLRRRASGSTAAAACATATRCASAAPRCSSAAPARDAPEATVVAGEAPAAAAVSPGQRRVLLALCRPFKDDRPSPPRPPTRRSPRSSTSASTRSRPTCGPSSRSSGSRTCRRTESGSPWSSARCRAAWSAGASFSRTLWNVALDVCAIGARAACPHTAYSLLTQAGHAPGPGAHSHRNPRTSSSTGTPSSGSSSCSACCSSS